MQWIRTGMIDIEECSSIVFDVYNRGISKPEVRDMKILWETPCYLERLKSIIRHGEAAVVKTCATAALFSHPCLLSG